MTKLLRKGLPHQLFGTMQLFSGGSGGGVPGIKNAVLYKSAQGITGLPRSNAYNAQMAVAVGRVIVALMFNGSAWRYSGGTWTQVNAGPIAAGVPRAMSADSRGYFYAGFDDGVLYRSIDQGVNWVAVNTGAAGNGYHTQIAENELGHLVYGNYHSLPAPATPELYRSQDGGGTWINITANLETQYRRHVHSCYYDHRRGMLVISGGDGADQFVNISSDFGDTFGSLPQTIQATGVVCDDDNFYYCGDLEADRLIYRMAIGPNADTIAGWQSVPAVPVFDPRSDPDINDFTAFTWTMGERDGTVVTSYGKGLGAAIVVASSDKGNTWQTLDKIVGDLQKIAFETFPQPFYNDNSGLLYGIDSSSGYLYQMMVIRPGGYLAVDSAQADNAGLPLRRIPEGPLTAGSRFQLTRDYPDNIIIGAAGVGIDTQGFQLGTDQTGTVLIDEGFEGISSLTTGVAGGVVIDQEDTTNPFEGARCCLIDMTAGIGVASGQVQKVNVGSTVGQEVWISGEFYIDSPVWGANDAGRTLYMADASFVTVCAIGIAVNGEWTLAFWDGAIRTNTQHIQSPVMAKLQEYQRLKLGVYVDDLEGWIRAYVDDQLIFEIVGHDTLNDGGIGSVRWGIQSRNYYRYYYDNCKAAVGVDCDLPAAVTGNPAVI